jgi:uncharacterized protein YbgA (DUF1722 family)/uncharacterized protein YbbK (DUF523 family)
VPYGGQPPIGTLKIGVSSCLLGAKVRFDGQHKRDAFLVDQLGAFVEWVAVCPELEVGMGVPRESVRLVRGGRDGLRMLGNRSETDWTARMRRFAERRVRALEGLVGYVLKSKSPSCGMERVKVHDGIEKRAPVTKDGVGLFAEALRARFPNLPIEEEGRLHDAGLRENFVERIFAYARLQALWQLRQPKGGRWTIGDLVAFHTAHKLALLAHHEPGYRELGRLVARARQVPRAALRAEYERLFMAALSRPATRKRHVNVLTHMLGHLRGKLDDGGRLELRGLIEDYHRGLVPLVVPVTMLRHHVERLKLEYLQGQTYLNPHPKELMLRNHV